MVHLGSPTPRLSVLVLSSGASHARALQKRLVNLGAAVICWMRLPTNREDWSPLLQSDVVLLVCPDDVDSEFATIEWIRDASPLTEIVCVCANAEVENAVESLHAGVYAVVPYNVAEERLTEVLSSACSRRRRGENRMQELDARVGNGRAVPPTPVGTKRPKRSTD